MIHPKHTKYSKQYKEHIEWVFQEGVPIWERANVQRLVSMAANIVDGHLIVGNRHFCPIMQMTIDNLKLRDENHCHDSEQGFVDQWGVYMSRQEAWKVAKEAGQIKEVFTEGVLYSECYL